MAGSFRNVLFASRDSHCPTRRKPFWSLATVCLLGLFACAAVAPANGETQTKPVLKLKTPDAAVRLFGASPPWLWLSALFAPSVERDKVVAIPVINTSTENIKLTATFVPTNGLAMAHPPGLTLADVSGASQASTDILANPAAPVGIPHGDTAQLKLVLGSTDLPAGLYTGQIQFKAESAGQAADPITQVTSVEVRIRHSAICALFVVLVGIVLGRLSQLAYDPQMIARVQLLDWIHQLEPKIAGVADVAVRAALKARLDNLRLRLFGRGVDAAKLQADFQTLEGDVNTNIGTPAIAATIAPAPPAADAPAPNRFVRGLKKIGTAFRILAGVTPLPLQTVYDRLLPFLLLLTLATLVVVFMVQQYGGAAAETFGAGGIADYAGLFLAGVASDAITGGLRAVKK